MLETSLSLPIPEHEPTVHPKALLKFWLKRRQIGSSAVTSLDQMLEK